MTIRPHRHPWQNPMVARVASQHPKLTVKRQTELLEVNRTSVYYKPSYEEDKDIELMHLIDMIYTRWPHYGYRRIREVYRAVRTYIDEYNYERPH